MTVKLKKLQYKGLPLESEEYPMFKETDTYKPELTRKTNSGIFRMEDQDEKDMYNEIMDRILKRKADLIDRDRRFCKDNRTWVIYLEWADKSYIYGEQT